MRWRCASSGLAARRRNSTASLTLVQRAAEAVFTPEGITQTRAAVAYYKRNAALLANTLDELGIQYTGGKHSPYIWLTCPDGMGSWDFFDLLLNRANLVGTPGAGFGEAGEDYFRLTGFGNAERTAEAARAAEEAVLNETKNCWGREEIKNR